MPYPNCKYLQKPFPMHLMDLMMELCYLEIYLASSHFVYKSLENVFLHYSISLLSYINTGIDLLHCPMPFENRH